MKTVIEIETAEELIALARKDRTQGDSRPYLNPKSNKVIFDGKMVASIASEDGKFQLSSGITPAMIIEAMARECNISTRLLNFHPQQ